MCVFKLVYMKRILAFLAIFLTIASTSYGAAPGGLAPPASSKTYRHIPGVTVQEISAIEALKSARSMFSYGALYSAEAFLAPGGFYGGFAAKFCELLSELFGIRFVLTICEWDELLDKFEARSIDFTGELTQTEERKQKYAMSLPIAQRMLRIYTHADVNKIQTEKDVKNSRIGILKGAITADSIRRAYPAVPFESIDIDNAQMAARMIKHGEIDAFVAEASAGPALTAYEFIRSSHFFPMVHAAVSMATANPELDPIISVLNKYIDAGGIDKLYKLYLEENLAYTKYKLYTSFTSEEKSYLNNLKQRQASVSVAYDHDNYPISFYNKEENALQGITVDVLAEINKLIDIPFKAATTKNTTWAEMFEKTKTGEIHMAAQLLRSEARREHFIWTTEPYSRSYYAIISKSEYPDLAVYQVARVPVGVMKQSGHADIYRQTFPNNNNLKEYDTFEECLIALEKGEVDLLMASEHMLLAQTNYREKPGLKMNIKLSAPMDSYFGFGKDEQILCSIIDKAQQYVKVDVIETKWTSRVFDYSKKLADNLSYFVTILLLTLITTVYLLAKNMLLGRQLKEIASMDALTGILNRRYFLELGLILLERTIRTGGESFIVVFDLDNFKTINDQYGHHAGDKVLQEAARRVQKNIRPYDLFGRYGGEEFIILMPDMNKTDALHVTERIRLELCKMPVEFEGKAMPISASFGVACAAPVNDMETAARYADKALYQAKQEGRNRVVFYKE